MPPAKTKLELLVAVKICNSIFSIQYKTTTDTTYSLQNKARPDVKKSFECKKSIVD
jgi:hypothetical protein